LKIVAPLLVIIFFLIRYFLKSNKIDRISKNEMASCITCGTFVSEELAIKNKNNIYCSKNCIK
tara:strand:+ start:897 stop:1085 length:189 start_codon:yes stop_codon:yes gene_type:complete